MVKIKTKKRIGLLSFFIVIQLFFMSGVELPSARGADLVGGGDVDAVLNMGTVGTSGPRAEVVFTDSIKGGNIKEARALASGFKAEEDDLYFTWYLQRSGCELASNPSDSDKSKCDKDSDGKITENDWKIEAARIIARNGYAGQSNGSTTNDGNNDGYDALPEWTGKNSEPNCYVEDYEDGRKYELKQTTESFACSNGAEAVCVSTQSLTCQEEDLPDNPGTFIDVSKQACQKQAVSPECKVTNAETFTAAASCSGGTMLCLSGAFESGLTSNQLCDGIGAGSLGDSCATLSDVVPTCTFTEKSGGNICQHLFPKPKGIGEESGDGDFGDAEENFWGTDLKNVSTAGNGNVDEANVVGLGVASFEWSYETGDMLGVAIEGPAFIKTIYHDGSQMIMWAFSKNKCSAVSDAAEERRFHEENINGLPEGTLTIGELDLNECLEENLLDPAGTKGGDYLDVGVSVSPAEPANDPLGVGSANKGSVVTATSILNNTTTDPSSASYQWSLEMSSDGSANPALWRDVTDELTEHSNISGLGNSSFRFKLNLPESVFPNQNAEQYLRVKVTATEAGSSGRDGQATFIFKIKQLGLDITPHKAVYSASDGKLSLGAEICASSEDLRNVCLVSNNEIMSAQIPDSGGTFSNFSWKINGKPLICDKTLSNDCEDGRAVNLTFFPITGAEGDVIEITAEATETATGIVKKFSKKFQIIKPYVKITSADLDQAWPKQLGYFKNLDGTFEVDLSELLLQSIEGAEVKLQASFFPDFMAGSENTKTAWKINGESVEGGTEVSFVADGGPGSVYNVSLEASYQQSQETRIALEKFWGIPQQQTVEERFEHSVQVEVLESEYDETVAMKGVGKFLANIASNVSGQMLFLLRIILTAGLLIGISGLVFSLAPSIGKKD